MIITWLQIAHIAVLGYWLGAELVINSGYRQVCFTRELPLAERSRMMDFVMRADQHVRYALILQASLGLSLASLHGYIPGGTVLAGIAIGAGAAWLALVEITHRLRKTPTGTTLARIDRVIRYLTLLVFAAIAFQWLGADWSMPAWLRYKMLAFAAIIACGVVIRLILIKHFQAWARLEVGEDFNKNNTIVQQSYKRATSVLVGLWVLIGVCVYLSVTRLN